MAYVSIGTNIFILLVAAAAAGAGAHAQAPVRRQADVYKNNALKVNSFTDSFADSVCHETLKVSNAAGSSPTTASKNADTSAEPLNGDGWTQDGTRNGKPMYKGSGSGSLQGKIQWDTSGFGFKSLGTANTPKWTAGINGHHRYYNEADTAEPPETGWVARTNFATGSMTIEFVPTGITGLSVSDAAGESPPTASSNPSTSAADLNGNGWTQDGTKNGKPMYKGSGSGSLQGKIQWDTSAFGFKSLGTANKAKWTAGINGHHRYYNEKDTDEPPKTGWVARTNFATGNMTIGYICTS